MLQIKLLFYKLIYNMFNLYTYEKQKALEEKRLKEKNDLIKIQENRKSKFLYNLIKNRKRKKISIKLYK